MHKSKLELVAMKIEDIANYIIELEQTDDIASNNGFEYVDWCSNELDEALSELGVDMEEFYALDVFKK